MSQQPAQFTPDTTTAIVGVGLIGGSIAAALKSRGHRGRIVGIGRNANRLESAVDAGLIDEFATDSAQVQADLYVFCTPVDRIPKDVFHASETANANAVFTDAGSVKELICNTLDADALGRFVGSHPLAGSEKRGFEYAEPDLFVDRVCIVTPTENSADSSVDFIEQFWRSIGMRTLRMSPAEHDAALAQTSHLPHLMASVLAGCLPMDWANLTSTGFADTTRIAAGDAELWTAILLQNQGPVLAACDRFEETWRKFRQAIETSDATELTRQLAQAKNIRDSINTD
ncbi:prephenate dehydrogenase [Thalassoroseus pseudoceratinae]|uniref:prephenate dehydrogenase n=1 Tax=Thalassoroseus pseudoceratinae TaxID=2713176 RepID=UPI00141E5749|nr:prephenate dehydrogenase/arogenate dehydrogenase family protein [Thalassoroseus pseudoceratinae]